MFREKGKILTNGTLASAYKRMKERAHLPDYLPSYVLSRSLSRSEPIRQIAPLTQAEEKAFAKMKAKFSRWQETPPEEREKFIRSFSDKLVKRMVLAPDSYVHGDPELKTHDFKAFRFDVARYATDAGTLNIFALRKLAKDERFKAEADEFLSRLPAQVSKEADLREVAMYELGLTLDYLTSLIEGDREREAVEEYKRIGEEFAQRFGEHLFPLLICHQHYRNPYWGHPAWLNHAPNINFDESGSLSREQRESKNLLVIGLIAEAFYHLRPGRYPWYRDCLMSMEQYLRFGLSACYRGAVYQSLLKLQSRLAQEKRYVVSLVLYRYGEKGPEYLLIDKKPKTRPSAPPSYGKIPVPLTAEDLDSEEKIEAIRKDPNLHEFCLFRERLLLEDIRLFHKVVRKTRLIDLVEKPAENCDWGMSFNRLDADITHEVYENLRSKGARRLRISLEPRGFTHGPEVAANDEYGRLIPTSEPTSDDKRIYFVRMGIACLEDGEIRLPNSQAKKHTLSWHSYEEALELLAYDPEHKELIEAHAMIANGQGP